MKILFKLYVRLFINRLKKAFSKISNILMTVFFIAWFFFSLYGFGNFSKMLEMNNPGRYMTMISLLILYLSVPGILSYFKKKGLVFDKADVQFLFQGPFHPKEILIVKAMITYLQSNILSLIILFGGILMFKEHWLLFLSFLPCYFVVDFFIQVSLIVLCYGTEKVGDENLKKISWLAYGILAICAFFIFVMTLRSGVSFEAFYQVIYGPWLKWIPIFGWEFAFVQLFFVEVNAMNILFSICYVFAAFGLTYLAYRMKCQGAYYEKAEEYASEIAEIRQRAKDKSGSGFGFKAKNLKNSHVTYGGSLAKAIFSRQLLEEKKKRFFIFDIRTLVFLAGGPFVYYLSRDPDFIADIYMYRYFVVPVILLYVTTIGFNGKSKWIKELQYPYTYLLPDSNFKKLWEATKIDHLKMTIDSALLAIPVGFILEIPFGFTVATILIAIFINANRLYIHTMVQTVFRNRLGVLEMFSSFLELIFMALVYAVPFLIVSNFYKAMSPEYLFITCMVLLSIITFILMYLSSLAFKQIEYVEK